MAKAFRSPVIEGIYLLVTIINRVQDPRRNHTAITWTLDAINSGVHKGKALRVQSRSGDGVTFGTQQAWRTENRKLNFTNTQTSIRLMAATTNVQHDLVGDINSEIFMRVELWHDTGGKGFIRAISHRAPYATPSIPKGPMVYHGGAWRESDAMVYDGEEWVKSAPSVYANKEWANTDLGVTRIPIGP